MSHATWYAGTLAPSSNWRMESAPRVQRPPAVLRSSRSPSPRRKKKTHMDAVSHSKATSPNQARQLSPCTDWHDKGPSYHYLDDTTPRSTPITPVTSTQRKKYRIHQGQLPAGKNISKSPSVPNLPATSTLALQGSLAGFMAMAVGNSTPRENHKEAAPREKSRGRSSEEHHGNDDARATFPSSGVRQQPKCTCSHSHLSPTPRLKVHTATPPVESPQADEGPAWLEQRDHYHTPRETHEATAEIANSNDHQLAVQNRNMIFKETSV